MCVFGALLGERRRIEGGQNAINQVNCSISAAMSRELAAELWTLAGQLTTTLPLIPLLNDTILCVIPSLSLSLSIAFALNSSGCSSQSRGKPQ